MEQRAEGRKASIGASVRSVILGNFQELLKVQKVLKKLMVDAVCISVLPTMSYESLGVWRVKHD